MPLVTKNNIPHKIVIDIMEGRKYSATNKLRQLINQNPDELSLREELALIYFESGFYDEAGKFWMLKEDVNSDVLKCIDIYKKSVNYSAHKILLDIRFKGNKNILTNNQLEVLNLLEKQSLKEVNCVPTFKIKHNVSKNKTKPEIMKEYLAKYLFFFILFVIFALIILGIIKIFDWF